MHIKLMNNPGKANVSDIIGISGDRVKKLNVILEKAEKMEGKVTQRMELVVEECKSIKEIIWAMFIFGYNTAVNKNAAEFAEKMTLQIFGEGAKRNMMFWACVDAFVYVVIATVTVLSSLDLRSSWGITVAGLVLLFLIAYRNRKK